MCIETGCKGGIYSKHMCRSHYDRLWRSKPSAKDYQKRWRENNADHLKVEKARHYLSQKDRYRQRATLRSKEHGSKYWHIRRARKVNAGVFVVTAKEINRLKRLPCFYCGNSGGEIDHIIPLSRGGRHSIGNLAPCCGTCNRRKSAKTVTEWAKSSMFYVCSILQERLALNG